MIVLQITELLSVNVRIIIVLKSFIDLCIEALIALIEGWYTLVMICYNSSSSNDVTDLLALLGIVLYYFLWNKCISFCSL